MADYDEMAAKVWPNIDELLARYSARRLVPDSVVDRLKVRWAGAGMEYVGHIKPQAFPAAGDRQINDCMTANSWRDTEEEVVDAIFNLLVLNFKARLAPGLEVGMVGMLVMLHAQLVKKGKLK